MSSKRLAPFKGTFKQNTGPYYSKGAPQKRPASNRSDKKKSIDIDDGMIPEQDQRVSSDQSPLQIQSPTYQNYNIKSEQSSKMSSPLQQITNFTTNVQSRSQVFQETASQFQSPVSQQSNLLSTPQQVTEENSKKLLKRETPKSKAKVKSSIEKARESNVVTTTKQVPLAPRSQPSTISRSDSFKEMTPIAQERPNVTDSRQNINDPKDEYYKEIIGDLMKKLENMNKENSRLQQLSESLSNAVEQDSNHSLNKNIAHILSGNNSAEEELRKTISSLQEENLKLMEHIHSQNRDLAEMHENQKRVTAHSQKSQETFSEEIRVREEKIREVTMELAIWKKKNEEIERLYKETLMKSGNDQRLEALLNENSKLSGLISDASKKIEELHFQNSKLEGLSLKYNSSERNFTEEKEELKKEITKLRRDAMERAQEVERDNEIKGKTMRELETKIMLLLQKNEEMNGIITTQHKEINQTKRDIQESMIKGDSTETLRRFQEEADKKILLLLKEIERIETLNHKLCDELEDRKCKFEEMENIYKRKFEGFKKEIEEFKNDQTVVSINREQETLIKQKTRFWEDKINSIIVENQKLNELVAYWQAECESQKGKNEETKRKLNEAQNLLSVPRTNEITRKLEREKEELNMAYSAMEVEYREKLKLITDQDIKLKGLYSANETLTAIIAKHEKSRQSSVEKMEFDRISAINHELSIKNNQLEKSVHALTSKTIQLSEELESQIQVQLSTKEELNRWISKYQHLEKSRQSCIFSPEPAQRQISERKPSGSVIVEKTTTPVKSGIKVENEPTPFDHANSTVTEIMRTKLKSPVKSSPFPVIPELVSLEKSESLTHSGLNQTNDINATKKSQTEFNIIKESPPSTLNSQDAKSLFTVPQIIRNSSQNVSPSPYSKKNLQTSGQNSYMHTPKSPQASVLDFQPVYSSNPIVHQSQPSNFGEGDMPYSQPTVFGDKNQNFYGSIYSNNYMPLRQSELPPSKLSCDYDVNLGFTDKNLLNLIRPDLSSTAFMKESKYTSSYDKPLADIDYYVSNSDRNKESIYESEKYLKGNYSSRTNINYYGNQGSLEHHFQDTISDKVELTNEVSKLEFRNSEILVLNKPLAPGNDGFSNIHNDLIDPETDTMYTCDDGKSAGNKSELDLDLRLRAILEENERLAKKISNEIQTNFKAV